MTRRLIAAVGVAAVLSAGCGGEGGGQDGRQAQPPSASAPAPTRAPKASTPPPATTSAPRKPQASGRTAEELVVALRQNGLPVLGWSLVTGPTDPDHLLGKPGQYTSKVTFSDRRLVSGGGTEAANLADGGAIEVFATPAAAARRVKALAGASAQVSRHGLVVLALSRRLGTTAVKRYRDAVEHAV